jgi:hypothetical protein
MKICLVVFLLTSLSAFGHQELSIAQQQKIVDKIAKEERKELWAKGHEYVTSKVSRLDKSALDVLVEQGRMTYDLLNQDDVVAFYGCINSPTTCTLFIIDITSEYMSGYGKDRAWILLNPRNGLVEHYVKQTVYSE